MRLLDRIFKKDYSVDRDERKDKVIAYAYSNLDRIALMMEEDEKANEKANRDAYNKNISKMFNQNMQQQESRNHLIALGQNNPYRL